MTTEDEAVPYAVRPVGEPSGAVQHPCAHPLAASVATVDGAVESLSFRLCDRTFDAPDSTRHGLPWVACDHALADPDFFARWRANAAHELAGQHSQVLGRTQLPEETQVPEKTRVPGETTAGYVLQWYLAIPTYLGALLFHSARRVPSLSPCQLGFRLERAVLREVVLHPGRFWCLPGDPDAGHPDAVPVSDETALGALLRRQVVAHATHFLAAYDPQVRFGSRTQWAAVTDMLDSGLLLAGRSFGAPRAGAADARLVLADGEEPLTSASRICEVTDDRGRTHWTRRRCSCCFLYALPGVESPCASCPRVTDGERARIFGARDPA